MNSKTKKYDLLAEENEILMDKLDILEGRKPQNRGKRKERKNKRIGGKIDEETEKTS